MSQNFVQRALEKAHFSKSVFLYSSMASTSGKLAERRKLFRLEADRGRPSSDGVPGGLVLFIKRHCSSSFSNESLLLFALSRSKLFLNESRSTESCLKYK